MIVPRDIRPAERGAALAAFYTVGGIMAGHELLETARDALFLASVPATRLPWLYLAIALLGMAIAGGPMGRLGRIFGARTLSVVLGLSAVITTGFWWLADPTAVWTLYATYIWSGLFATLVVVQFWTLLGRLFTATQAKRVFRFVGVGAILGAIAGSLQATLLAWLLDADQLLLAAGGTLLLAGIGPLFLARVEPIAGDGGEIDLADCVSRVGDHSYSRRLALLVLLATVAFTLVDYVFKNLAAAYVPAHDLGTFFAVVNVGLNVGSLLAQLVLARWLLGTLGLHRTLAILPLMVVLGTAGVAVTGALAAVLVLKGLDGSLRHSVNRTATELLYVPMADDLRASAKMFTDVVVQRGAQALASLAILGTAAWLQVGDRGFAAAAGVFAAGWLVVVLLLRKPYLDLFRRTLEQQSVRTRVDFPSLDVTSLESLIAGLNSTDDSQVLAVIDLLAAQKKFYLVPDLILYHPSEAVVLRALELFPGAKGDSALPMLDRLLGHPAPAIRAAALRARMAVEPAPQVARELSCDVSPEVCAVALCGLVTGDDTVEAAAARERLAAIVEDGGLAERRAVATAIAADPSTRLMPTLLALATNADPDVRTSVCRAFGALADERAVPALIAMLDARAVREEARDALVAIGGPALAILDHALDDRSWSPAIRQHIPRTIARFDPEQAAPILLAHLSRDPDGVVRFKLLRGLGHLRNQHPALPLAAEPLERMLAETLTKAFRSLHWRTVLTRAVAADPAVGDDTLELLIELLADKQHHALERIFRLLDLLRPGVEMEEIFRGLLSPDRRTQSSSRELIAELAPPAARDALVALTDDGDVDQQLAAATPFYVPRAETVDGVLAAILDAGSETLGTLVVRYVADRGVSRLRPQVDRAAAGSKQFLAQAAAQALARMDGATGG